jgi:hypothetical protein
MTYRVEVTAPTIHELSGKLAALASQLKGLPSTFDVLRVEAAEMPRAAKAQPAPAPEPGAAPAPEPEPEPEPVEIKPARTYAYAKEVAPHVLGLVNKRGRDATKAVLARFGVTTASQLDASRYGELMAAVDAALVEK